ncbi:MAG: META domain-containing protein [Xanthobacteraceae bacterium]
MSVRLDRMTRRCVRWALALGIAAASLAGTGVRAEEQFPFDRELLLDAQPMKGSKRIPILAVGRQGETTIDLWCNSVEGQIVVVDGIISIMTGAKTNRPCDAARLRGDDEILKALLDAKTWRREGNVVTFSGARTLRFRIPTN